MYLPSFNEWGHPMLERMNYGRLIWNRLRAFELKAVKFVALRPLVLICLVPLYFLVIIVVALACNVAGDFIAHLYWPLPASHRNNS